MLTFFLRQYYIINLNSVQVFLIKFTLKERIKKGSAMMENIYELGATIKNLRTKQKMTQKRLGKILNVSEATISKYENNTAIPQFETLRTIAATFNVSMDMLCGMPNDKTVSVWGLSAEQASVVDNLIDIFRSKNFASNKVLSDEQYALLGKIVVELLRNC